MESWEKSLRKRDEGELYVTNSVFSSDRLNLHETRVPWLIAGVNPFFELLGFSLCYTAFARPEDTATLGSDRSAEAGG